MFGLDGSPPPKIVDAEGNELTVYILPGATLTGKVVGLDASPGFLMNQLRIVFQPDDEWIPLIKEKMAEAAAIKAAEAEAKSTEEPSP